MNELRGVKLNYELSDSIEDLRRKRNEFVSAARTMLDQAEKEKRGLEQVEERDYDELMSRADMINSELRTREINNTDKHVGIVAKRIGIGGQAPFDSREETLVLKPEQRMADLTPQDPQNPLSLGKYLRGIVTGNWTGAEAERRAMSVGTLAGGGYMVPTPLSNAVIDKARNKTRVIQAGAMTVPMYSETLTYAKLTGDATAAWKNENAAITASDLQFTSIKFTAQTLTALVKMSVELFEDAANIDSVIENSIAQVLAIELDRAALRGSGTAPEPRGIRNTAGIQTIDLGANGATLTDYSNFALAAQKIQEANGPDRGISVIYAPRTAGTLDRLKDSYGQPMRPPASVAAMKLFATTQVPINNTKGTATNASEAYVADFSQLMIGMRTNLVLEVSREAADATNSAFGNLQVWIRAYLRADIQLAQPGFFVLIDGILP